MKVNRVDNTASFKAKYSIDSMNMLNGLDIDIFTKGLDELGKQNIRTATLWNRTKDGLVYLVTTGKETADLKDAIQLQTKDKPYEMHKKIKIPIIKDFIDKSTKISRLQMDLLRQIFKDS